MAKKLSAGILLYLVTSRERLAWLQLWQECVGGLVAVAMFAPVVWIDWTRNWQSFHFQLGRSTLGEHVLQQRDNPRYRFLSSNATKAAGKYGVKTIELLATRPA